MARCWRLPLVYLAPPPAVQSGHAHPHTQPAPVVEDRISAATWFADRGFGVFSVWSADADGTCRCAKGAACGSAGKHPIGRQGFLEHTRDHNRIRTLLSAGSEPNYGLVCPDGVLVLDVDGDGVARLAELEAGWGRCRRRCGRTPPTASTCSCAGRRACRGPSGSCFGYVTRWGSGPGAGYVIGPRSVHASGAVYAPAGPCTEIAELPDAWARAAAAPPPADEDAIEVGGRVRAPAGRLRRRPVRRRSATTPPAATCGASARRRSGRASWASWRPRFAVPLSEPELRERFERAWRGTAERLGDPVADPGADAAIMAAAAAAPAEPAADAAGAPRRRGLPRPAGRDRARRRPAHRGRPGRRPGTLLASVGAAMGGLRYIYQGSAQAPNLFVVLVGDSSTGRKGTAGSIAREVMNRAYPDWSR